MNISTLLMLSQFAVAGAPEQPVLACEDLPVLFSNFRRAHYSPPAPSEAERRSVAQFIDMIDPSRMLLLEGDVKRLEKELPLVFRTMRAGRCTVLEDAMRLAIARAEEDLAKAKEVLGPKYKLDEQVELELDRDKRGHAKTPEQRGALVEKMIHFQMSNLLLASQDVEKARKQLVHRYELAVKRLKTRLDGGELPNLYATAYASALDPHSDFLSASVLAEFQINMRLSLEGIGAALSSQDGFTVIETLVPGGQADKQGVLRPKDKIIAVSQDGEEPVSTIDMELRDVVAMIRGKKGTKVTLTVLREGAKTETFDTAIVRDKIDVKDHAAKIDYETREIGGKKFKIGVLELPSFYGGHDEGRSASADVRKLLEEAKAAGVDGIVLNVSRNGGGVLEEAVLISGLFIQTGAVVGTKDSSGAFQMLEDEDDATVYNGPLVVMTSPGSASASEILAGALQDYGRAVIVGAEHTFGKGTVQSLTGLPGGLGAVKVTTGMFFLPGGASTQQRGVPSDIVVPSLLNGYDIGEDKLDNPLPPQSVKKFVSGSANAKRTSDRWRAVSPAVIAELAKRSKARVAESAEMKEIAKQLDENKKKEGPVRLAEIRKEAKKDGTEDDTQKKVERMDKAVVTEMANIAADLASLGSTANLTQTNPKVD